MAEDSEETGGETPEPKAAAKHPPGKSETSSDLPNIESPPLSPAEERAPAAPEPVLKPTDLVVFAPEAASPARARFRFKARHKRTALFAASVAIAAALGVVVGMAASGGFAAPKRSTAASLADRQAIQHSIGKLSKEIATLKASITAANGFARSSIAKTAERLRNAPEITGSIPELPAAVPAPLPRPAVVKIRPPVVHGWSIRYVRDGYVYVRGHGDTYQVQLGAPLPGLGPVQEVKRQDGHWLVVTPKGLIVSMRDRRYFEQF